MSNCFPSFIGRWILNFMDQLTHENWYPTNKSDFTVGEKNYDKDYGYSRKITQISVKGFNDIFNKDTTGTNKCLCL
jgi:hypothetical protein